MALDDFGIGYSSIGYLRSFALTRLKLINRWPGWWMWMPRPRNWFAGPCVSPGAGNDGGGRRVENQQQLALLRRARIRSVAGFYFSEPMPITSLLQLRQQLGLMVYSLASASSLSRKPVTEIARLSARQRSFAPGAELCTAMTCQPVSVFNSDGEPLSPGAYRTDGTAPWSAPSRSQCSPDGCTNYQMVFRVAGLGDFSLRHLQRGGESGYRR